jgi:hypothetical protein
MVGIRLLGPVVALGLSAAACGSAPLERPSQSTPDVNVTGTIDRGSMPTCPAGEPCDPAMVAALLVFSRPGSPDVTVRVAGDGSFALHLEPGSYTIAAAPPSFQGTLVPSTVRVPASGSVHLSLHIAKPA